MALYINGIQQTMMPASYPASRTSFNNTGTGMASTNVQDALTELNADKANKDLSNVTGTLDTSHGGTGQTTLQATRNAMGLGNTTGALPIANGGTGSTTAANARTALGLGDLSTKSLKQASFSSTSDANGNITLASGYRKVIIVTCTQARAFAWCSDTGGQQNTYLSFREFTSNNLYASRPVSGAYWYIE